MGTKADAGISPTKPVSPAQVLPNDGATLGAITTELHGGNRLHAVQVPQGTPPLVSSRCQRSPNCVRNFATRVNVKDRPILLDLDNTLYDWVSAWHAGFAPMLGSLRRAGLVEPALLDAIKDVHQRHGTSEYAGLLIELANNVALWEGVDSDKALRDAAAAHKLGQEEALHPYPGVLSTLDALEAGGARIIAVTDSQVAYSAQKCRLMALDDQIEALYAMRNSTEIADILRHPLALSAGDSGTLHCNVVLHPPGIRKPNPAILRELASKERFSLSDALYVGDNLFKDILMANEAGATSVHALYGEAHKREEYELLKRVTHWSPDDVKSEANAREDGILPKWTLRKSMEELLSIV